MSALRLARKGLKTIRAEGFSAFWFKTSKYLYTKMAQGGGAQVGAHLRHPKSVLLRRYLLSPRGLQAIAKAPFYLPAFLFYKILERTLTVRQFETPKYFEIKRWYRRNKRKVTIVIPTYNQTTLVKRCVDSIRKQKTGKDVEIIVVDDGSSKPVQAYLKRKLAARVILKSENEGFAKTVNVGLREVEKSDVVILNNDTVAHSSWLEALQFCAYSDRRIGIVGPKLLYPNGTIQSAGSFRHPVYSGWFDHYYRHQPANHPPANVQADVVAVTGACMYIKQAVIKKIGILDERFAMAMEDVDYCIRAANAGFRTIYCPYSALTHFEARTRGLRQGPRELTAVRAFWEKWRDWFDKRKVTDGKGRIKVIYVLDKLGLGGGRRVVMEHLNGLKDKGFNVSLYVPEQRERLDWFDLRVPLKRFRSYSDLGKALAKEKAIKVATWWETAEHVWRASLVNGTPVYLVQDIETSYYPDNTLKQAEVLASYRREFRYLTTSKWNKKQLEEMGFEPTAVPPGVDTKTFKLLGIERKRDMLLTIGREHLLKNLDLTLSAWRRTVFRPTLVFFGNEKKLKKVPDKYVFFPTDEEVARLYNKATVFVLTSRHEGFGLPILEAMACGCPVVCTDADGNMDFCRSGINCLVVRDNNPEHLAQTLDCLFEDEEMQKFLSKNALETAKQYAWKIEIDQLENFYRKLAGVV